MSVDIKICGITRVEDAQAAMELGASMLGLNFYPQSPRCISLERAQEIARVVAFSNRKAGCDPLSGMTTRTVRLVGVFVNMDISEVLRIARAVPLDSVQLHGDESPADCATVAAEFYVIRALKVDTEFSPARVGEFAACRALLLDTPSTNHGGSGKSFEWSAVEWSAVHSALPAAKLILAGGLDARNVAEAIAVARPDVVDVCSGVESTRGIKSLYEMGKFVAAVRAAEWGEP
jgi:phosphoribosylanthranilate isomerase